MSISVEDKTIISEIRFNVDESMDVRVGNWPFVSSNVIKNLKDPSVLKFDPVSVNSRNWLRIQ